MRSSTRLDSAVFQLTPTRTRCKFVVFSNGKTVQIAHGIVAPFIDHLKVAQDQMAKGGYSIVLEPDPGADAPWFTMETIQRFVRFVLTPEVLERVQSLELEIVQIEEAIAMQGTIDMEDSYSKTKPTKQNEGTKQQSGSNEDKAIILYEPGTMPTASNDSSEEERKSKAQLMKVLETRKIMLRKEQGMAFARAAAAGFEIDNLAHLMTFSEYFGAQRLKDACTRFRDLWRRKHETGQWLEVDAAEAMAARPDMAAMNASGITLSSPMNKQWLPEGSENGKHNDDSSSDQQASFSHQYPHPMYPTWPIHPPPGVFPGYSMQGVPFYPGNAPFYNPQYPVGDDPRFVNGKSMRRRRHSMDDDDEEDEESVEDEREKSRSQDDADLGFQSYESRRRGSKSGKKKSGMVVIKNVNYYSSKKGSVDGKMEADSESEGEEDDPHGDPIEEGRSASKKKEGGGGGGGQWDAFQSFLLNISDKVEQSDKNGMMQFENDAKMNNKKGSLGDDPLCLGGRNSRENEEHELDLQSAEINGVKSWNKNDSDDFIIGESKNQTGSSFDPLVVSKYEQDVRANSSMKEDTSFLVSLEGNLSEKRGSVQANSYDMESEFVSGLHKSDEKRNYEPDELVLVPRREVEKNTAGYDPVLDFSLQVPSLGKSEVESEEIPEKIVDLKMKIAKKSEKNNAGLLKRNKPSKMSTLDDAKARADRLRNYKADLQKLKKEKEEEQIKRLEALKQERQKRIASRSGSVTSVSSQSARKSVKNSSGSKFSDSGFGSSSPLQRSKASSVRVSGEKSVNQKTGNRLNKSVSSLPEGSKENDFVNPEAKASMANLRRLSEPKTSSEVKNRKSGPSEKKMSAIITHDKHKVASLPELKIKSSKLPDVVKGKSLKKNEVKTENLIDISQSNAVEISSDSNKISDHTFGDYDNNIVEKTLVMLEPEQPNAIVEKEEPLELTYSVSQPENGTLENHAINHIDCVDPVEVEVDNLKIEVLASDENTLNPDDVKLDSIAILESQQPLVPESESLKSEKIREVSEKTKESSKGFRRLLKFGRKSHHSDLHSEADTLSASGSETDDSVEVHNLKNQDEGTSHKSSRHFSILSPFRSKSVEKKQTA